MRSLGLGQVGEDKSFAAISKGYIFTLRCTPPIVLLFLVFYGLPEFLKWWLGLDINNWSKTIFVLLTMILLFAAIVAEVFKAAYQAIPKGQTEAGLSIGLTPSQTFGESFSSSFSSCSSQHNNRYSQSYAGCCLGLYDWFC